jgi:hypothetical protein
MRISLLSVLVLTICGSGVAGNAHEHGHHHEEQIPLHEREYVQDSPEELERKWTFEVSTRKAVSFVLFRGGRKSKWNFFSGARSSWPASHATLSVFLFWICNLKASAILEFLSASTYIAEFGMLLLQTAWGLMCPIVGFLWSQLICTFESYQVFGKARDLV